MPLKNDEEDEMIQRVGLGRGLDRLRKITENHIDKLTPRELEVLRRNHGALVPPPPKLTKKP